MTGLKLLCLLISYPSGSVNLICHPSQTGISSASSCSSASSYKTCASSFSSHSISLSRKKSAYASVNYARLGHKSNRSSTPFSSRPLSSNSSSSCTSAYRSGGGLMTKKDNRIAPVESNRPSILAAPRGKLTLIQEFQREFRNGTEKSATSARPTVITSSSSGTDNSTATAPAAPIANSSGSTISLGNDRSHHSSKPKNREGGSTRIK